MYLIAERDRFFCETNSFAGAYSGSSAGDSRLFGRIATENRIASAHIFVLWEIAVIVAEPGQEFMK